MCAFECRKLPQKVREVAVTAKRKVVTYRKQASRMASFGALRYDREPLTEVTAVALMRRGVHAPVMRLPQVHDTVRQGLITPQIAVAQAKEVSAYVGKGQNRWLLHRAKLWPSDRV